MKADGRTDRVLNLAGSVAERIIPGYVGFETYFEHIERYLSADRVQILQDWVRRLLPKGLIGQLRINVRLPARTGIPRRVLRWHRDDPTRFEEWVLENRFISHYRPAPLPAGHGHLLPLYGVYLAVARKAGRS